MQQTGPSSVSTTVEPLNKGHFGASHVVLCREVVLFSEVQNVWEWYFEECPLQRGCPFLGGSFIRGSTVNALRCHANLFAAISTLTSGSSALQEANRP